MSDYRGWLREHELAVFLFHGVIPERRGEVRNYTLKHLELIDFRTTCEQLAAAGNPLSIDGALDALAGRRPLPPRSFVISFDDGFRNNLTVAAPVLEELGLPAVFYCTSSFVCDNGASWIDLIEDAVARTREPALALPWAAQPRPAATGEDRRAMLEEIRAVVKGDPKIDPYALADELRAEAGAGPFAPDPELDQKLTPEELAQLAELELFTVGGHGHSHRILAYLDDADLRREVDLSLELLGEILGGPVRHYSYPEGTPDAYDERVIELLRSRGIVCSPTAEPGVNAPGADPFRLKRITVDRPPARAD